MEPLSLRSGLSDNRYAGVEQNTDARKLCIARLGADRPLLDIPFKLPPNHPTVSVIAGRAYLWLERERDDIAVPFAREIFRRSFAEGLDVSSVAAVLDLAASFAVRDDLSEALLSPELKERFRQKTEEALQRGVFGSPFFLLDGEPFWGADRLPMMDEWLQRGGW